MILALITSTLNQLAQPEESLHTKPAVLTPLSMRAFHRAEDIYARQLSKTQQSSESRIPSLRELLIHYCCVNLGRQDLQRCQDMIPNKKLAHILKKNIPFYLQYNEDDVAQSKHHLRQQYVVKPWAVFLTSATLVVVPSNLLNQWWHEILKHCEDSLQVCIIQDNSPLPPAMELATSYDVCV